MNTRLLCEVIVGCLLGIGFGAAMMYGLVEAADWIVEHTHAVH